MPWYAVFVLVVPLSAVGWFGIRRSERFQRWVARKLKRQAAGLDPAIDPTFARSLEQDARDKGAV